MFLNVFIFVRTKGLFVLKIMRMENMLSFVKIFPMLNFKASWKSQKPKDFVMFSGDKEM